MPPPSAASRIPERIRRLGKVHHVALIVRSIEDALGLWRDMLGLELETVMDIPDDHVRIAFLAIGESRIELVEPTDDTTGVARFLASKGEGFHHVCFEVANLAETLLKLEISGLELIDTAARRGAEGPVAFIHPRACHGVLVELIEAPGGPAWTMLGFAAPGSG
jgi:methylmalonyl-CoA/ethylmalonyl-CoA epimerase